MTYELNIEIVTVESVWDLPLHGESLNFSTSFYMLDQPLLDVNVRGFGEKMLGSPCRPLSSIFEDVTRTTSLQSTLFFRYVTDFSLSLFRQTKLIPCLQVALRFTFCISRFLGRIKFTKLVI